MQIPNPSLNSIKGAAVLVVAVAIAVAFLSQTGVGQQIQGAANSAAARVPV